MPVPQRSEAEDDGTGLVARPIGSGLFDCDESWDLAPRRRGHYQVWAITSGEMDFRISATATRRLEPRTLVLLPPRAVQRARWRAGPLQTYVTHFMPFDHGVPHLTLWPAAFVPRVDRARWDRIIADLAELTALLSAPGAPAGGPARPTRLLATAAMTAVVGRIDGLDGIEAIGSGSSRRVPATVAAAIAHIRRHPDQPLSTGVLAELTHTSPDALRTAFRRTLGQSPGEFVRQHRLGIARSLLRDSDLSVAAIAGRTGFPDAFYFSRVFRAAEGVPPSQWRESLDESITPRTTDARTTPYARTPPGGHR